MDDANRQALLSALRSLFIVIGGAMAAHGVISETLWTQVSGPIVALIPIIIGIWDKYNAEKKTAAREVIAVQAGIAAKASGEVGIMARPADVPQLIKDFAPTTQQEPK